MEARITQFFDRYIKGSYFPEMHITDIIEIIIIAFLVYQLMTWIKNESLDAAEGNCGSWCIHSFGVCLSDAYDIMAGEKFTYCSCNCHHSSVSAGAAPRVGKIGREKIYCGSCTF